MDTLNQLMQGFVAAGTPVNLLWCLLGCTIGTAVGAIVAGCVAALKYQIWRLDHAD